MDQYQVFIVFIISFLNCPLISSHQIELIAATSIYPCLDSFDILVNLGSTTKTTTVTSTSNSSKVSEMTELIRIYTTDDPNLHLRQYYYLKEYKVPPNRLVKINCNFFNPESKYYCFSYVSMSKVNLSISLWTQPECKLALNQNQDSSLTSSDDSHLELTKVTNNTNQSAYSSNNISDNNSPSKDYQYAIISPHGPSFTFTSTTHETSTDYKRSDLAKKATSFSPPSLALKLVKCRCNHAITYQYSDNLTTTDQFVLEIFPCAQKTIEPMCGNSSSIPKSLSQSDFDPLCLINLTHPQIKLQLQIVKSLSCDTMSTDTIRQQQHQRLGPSQLTPILRDGPYSIDPQLEVNGASITTHQLSSPFVRIESTNNQYYLIHVTLINTETTSQHPLANLFTSILNFFSSFELIWLTIFALTGFIVVSIVIFLCVYLIVPIKRRKLKVQIVLLGDLANTATSFVEASSIENFDFDESGSLEMDYYDYEMHSTKGSVVDKLSSTTTINKSTSNSIIKSNSNIVKLTSY